MGFSLDHELCEIDLVTLRCPFVHVVIVGCAAEQQNIEHACTYRLGWFFEAILVPLVLTLQFLPEI